MSPLLADPAAVSAGALDVRADDGLEIFGLLDPGVLAVLGGALALVVVLTVLAGWLVLRRVRRSALVGRGRDLAALGRTGGVRGRELAALGRDVSARGLELGVQGAAALAAVRLPPGVRRTAAQLLLQISQGRSRLRRQLTAARAGGVHLGDVPALLPSLQAEGARLERRLRQLTLAPAAADRAVPAELESEAAAYLGMLAEVSDAVLHAPAPASSPRQLAADVDDAVAGLRAHAAAYAELTAPPAPVTLPSPTPLPTLETRTP